MEKNFYKISFKISAKYYLSFIFIVILIMLLFRIFIIFTLTKLSKSSRKEALKSGRNYMNKWLEGAINKITFKISKTPKISVIVPIYNSQKTIKSAISSIQNQNMIDIEIILINDYSKDNSSQIIEEILKNDPRVVI